jgi:ParB-like chromosome segregation protein Spo0J
MGELNMIQPKGTTGHVPVFCVFDEIIDIEKAIPNPKNPNTHPESQLALLAKIILAQGWRSPITISKRSGFIVKGHGRLMAAKTLGLESVPVDFQEYETEADEYADLIADNRLSELSNMDAVLLKDLLQELNDGDFCMDLTGFDKDSLDSLLTLIQ